MMRHFKTLLTIARSTTCSASRIWYASQPERSLTENEDESQQLYQRSRKAVITPGLLQSLQLAQKVMWHA